ncbi:hypothetical protein [uncultured Fusobacterium sp.]|uniref:hypothetical protein n=1 Tax=uncultured Fusobacterium sp. TaxID=159267 RepID=UPI0025D8985B|nr:hypothetical protein [uncultured Fusobacterium sp.]
MADNRNLWEKFKDKIKGNKYLEIPVINELEEKIGHTSGMINKKGERIGIWEEKTFEDFEEIFLIDYENHTITKPSVYNKDSKIVEEYKMTDKEFQDYGKYRFVPENYEKIRKVYEDNILTTEKITNCKNRYYNTITKHYSKTGELEKEIQETGSSKTGFQTKVKNYKAEKEFAQRMKEISERNYTGKRTEPCVLSIIDQNELSPNNLPKEMTGDYVFGHKTGIWKTDKGDELLFVNNSLVSAKFKLEDCILKGDYNIEGERTGTWIKQDLNSKKRVETEYKDNKEKEVRDFDSKGELVRTTNFEKGYQITSFFEDGKKIKEIDMSKRVCKEFYPSGALKSEETLDSYNNSTQDPAKRDKTFYYESGNVEKVIKGLRETEFLNMEGQYRYEHKIKNRSETKAITSMPKQVKNQQRSKAAKSKGQER